MIETRDILPNGLPSSAVARRPDPFIGMLYCWQDFKDGIDTSQWYTCRAELLENFFSWTYILLPGEENCPWPPPEQFRHEWKEGDKAYIFLAIDGWCEAVARNIGGQLWFAVYVCADTVFCPLYRPAIYIPEGE